MRTASTPGQEVDRPEDDKRIGRVAGFAEAICMLALVALVVLVGAEAIVRNVFHSSLQAVDEVGGYLLVVVTFFGLAVGEAADTFHRVQLVLSHLSRRTQAKLLLCYDYLCLLCMAILLWELVELVLESWRSGDVAPTILATPLWLAQLSMPIGAALACGAIVRTIMRRHHEVRER